MQRDVEQRVLKRYSSKGVGPKIHHPRARALYRFLSGINRWAYRNPTLISNPALSKDVFFNRSFGQFVRGRNPGADIAVITAADLIRCYLVNGLSFGWFLVELAAVRLFGGVRRPRLAAGMVMLDTFIQMDAVVRADAFQDSYFPGVVERLDARQLSYVYIGYLIGSHNLPKLMRSLRIMKRQHTSICNEFHLLGIADVMRLFVFILRYPTNVRSLAKVIRSDGSKEARVTARALKESLGKRAWNAHARFLMGRNIAQRMAGRLLCISWYENQALQKNLYRGLRASCAKASEIRIIGAQLYLWSDTTISMHPDANEKAFGVLPDRLLVNGPFYLPEHIDIESSVGPSLRYAHIFKSECGAGLHNAVLILLPYFGEELDYMLDVISGIPVDAPYRFFVKFHPGVKPSRYSGRLNPAMRVVEESLESLFTGARIVVSSASGTLLEALACGIPAVEIADPGGIRHYILPEEMGKGEIWARVETTNDLMDSLAAFYHITDNCPKRMQRWARRIRQHYFQRPTNRAIDEAFELSMPIGTSLPPVLRDVH